jgi:hypothetical protein
MLRLTDLRPDKNTDRKAWNKSWEDDLKQYEIWERFDPPHITLPPEYTRFRETMLPKTRLVLERHTKDICSLQEDIRGFALSQEGLEEKWKGLSDLQREDLILAAIVTTCCIGPDMEDFRKWCPEITLATMGKTKGQGFMDLLTMIVTHDPGKAIRKPISFKNKVLERNWDHPLLQSQRENIISNRCYFISLFVWRVLLALVSL